MIKSKHKKVSNTILNFKEASDFIGFSKSYLYKLTSQQQIKHYKPRGKKIYFKQCELEDWLLRNPIKTIDEIEQESIDALIK